jgi:transcription elongation factor
MVLSEIHFPPWEEHQLFYRGIAADKNLHKQLMAEYKNRVSVVKETYLDPEKETFYKLDNFIFNYRTLHYTDFYIPKSFRCSNEHKYQRKPYAEHFYCFNIKKGCLRNVSADILFK